MRCPKCGYNSFDHNHTCPKCRKDLGAARRLLNLNIPVNGAVDFFQAVGQRQYAPQAFIEPDNYMEPTLTPNQMMPTYGQQTAAASSFNDVYPVQSGGMPGANIPNREEPLEEIMPMLATQQPAQFPGMQAPSPYPAQNPFQAQAPNNVYTGPDEEIEIEIDAMTEEPEPFQQPMPSPAVPHQATMNQITSTLAETGDLSQPTQDFMSDITPVTEMPLEELSPFAGQSFDDPGISEIQPQNADFFADESNAMTDFAEDTANMDVSLDDITPQDEITFDVSSGFDIDDMAAESAAQTVLPSETAPQAAGSPDDFSSLVDDINLNFENLDEKL